MPQKTVVKNDCERCGRTWFSEECTDTVKVVVRMKDVHGAMVVEGSYDVLCESCGQTVGNLLKALVREMKKLGAKKPKAKKEGAVAPPSESPPMLAANSGLGPAPTVHTPPTAVSRLPLSGVSKRL